MLFLEIQHHISSVPFIFSCALYFVFCFLAYVRVSFRCSPATHDVVVNPYVFLFHIRLFSLHPSRSCRSITSCQGLEEQHVPDEPRDRCLACFLGYHKYGVTCPIYKSHYVRLYVMITQVISWAKWAHEA